MTLTIDIPPELESRLRDEAARQGVDARTLIVRALEQRLGVTQSPGQAASLSKAEAELLQKINLGVSQEDWARYRDLVAKRRAETLADGEQAELVALSDRIERANAERVRHLIELARLRGTTLDALMRELQISGPSSPSHG
jgi:hypothetical protein